MARGALVDTAAALSLSLALSVPLTLALPLSISAPLPALAQPLGRVQAEVLVLNADRLFLETRFGMALRQDYEDERKELIESNRQIQSELEAEEQELTDKRKNMTPKDFRALADAFDEKVQKIRGDNERIAMDLEVKRDQAPAVFLHKVQPILAQLMKEAGAVVILESSTVLLRSDDIDITDRAIKMIDEAIGDGSTK